MLNTDETEVCTTMESGGASDAIGRPISVFMWSRRVVRHERLYINCLTEFLENE